MNRSYPKQRRKCPGRAESIQTDQKVAMGIEQELSKQRRKYPGMAEQKVFRQISK